MAFETEEDVAQHLPRFIDCYNERCLHSALSYQSLTNFEEEQARKPVKSAARPALAPPSRPVLHRHRTHRNLRSNSCVRPDVHRRSGEGVVVANAAGADRPDGGDDSSPTAPVTVSH